MRIAVTGADGFVGRHLCAYLEAQGDTLLALSGPPHRAGVNVVDVLDDAAIARALAPFEPEAIVHLAGASSVAKSHEAPRETFRLNAIGGLNVCIAVRSAAPKARVLFVGSGEMYGTIPVGERASETWPLAPTSPYAASKVAAEVTALQFHRAYGLHAISVRPFNHLGRGQLPTFAVPSFARQLCAMKGRGVLSVGNLDSVRDFSHVDDVVAAYRLLLDRGVPGEAYNVCSGVGRTVRSVVEEMIVESGVDAHIEIDPARVRPVELPYLVGDSSKLRALGWEPQKRVKDALDEALAEARESASR